MSNQELINMNGLTDYQKEAVNNLPEKLTVTLPTNFGKANSAAKTIAEKYEEEQKLTADIIFKSVRIEIGTKVVPHSKSADGRVKGLENSAVWREALAIKQPFLYVTRLPMNTGDYPEIMLGLENEKGTGDYFHIRDIKLFKTKNNDSRKSKTRLNRIT